MKESENNFFKKEVVTRVAAAGLAGVIAFGGGASAFAESQPKNTDTSSSTGAFLKDDGQDEKYAVAYEKIGVTPPSMNIASTEVAINVEQKQRIEDKKIIIQIGQPYYMVTNPNVPGENNILRKNDTSPVIINDRTMVPLRLIGETLGAEVNWNGETSSVTLNKDGKEVKVQIGNNLMVVKDNNNIREVTLDSSPLVDENSRTLVPIRAISEAFGKTVLWDNDTKSVLVGYSQAEKDSLFSGDVGEAAADAIDLNSNFKAFEFMAGGEFADCVDMGPFAIRDEKSGAVVAFSEQDFLDIDEKVAPEKNNSLTREQLYEKYMDASVVGKVRDKLKDGDFVWVMGGEAYVFNKEFYWKGNTYIDKNNNYINRINENGDVQKIEREDGFSWFKPQVCWDRDLGVCLSNGLIITDKFNPATNKFEELNTYVELGTPEQTIRKKLDKLVNNVGTGLAFDKTPLNNSMSLDKSEVQKYMETGDDQGFKSFEIIKDADGKPRIVLVKSECGFDDLNVKVLRDVFKFLNKIDPDYLKKQSTTDCLTVDCYKGENFLDTHNSQYGSTFGIYDYGSVMLLPNEMKPEYMNVYDGAVLSVVETFVAEDRGLKNFIKEKWIDGKLELTSINRLDKSTGMDKSLFAKNKIEDWKKNGKITQEQYNILMPCAQDALDFYIKKTSSQ